jgi:hypothetical protein
MSPYRPLAAILPLAFALVLGCASAPKVVDPNGVDVSLRFVTEAETTTRWDTEGQGMNPYMTPSSMFSINNDQFYVVEMTIAAARSAKVEVYAIKALDAEGAQIARFFDWTDFAAYIQSWKQDDQGGLSMARKANATYLKSLSFDMQPGRRSYIAVLIGKKPLVGKFRVEALVGVDEDTRKIAIEVGK